MKRGIAAGASAGLISGCVFAMLMLVIPVGGRVGAMIALAASVADASSSLVGWLVYAAYGCVAGALFGALLDGQTANPRVAALWGALYGVGWWIIAELFLVPLLVGSWSWSFWTPEASAVGEVAVPLLAGHVVYGVVLGTIWSRATGGRPRRRQARAEAPPLRRAA
jgi:hypothetical protein